MVKKRVRFFLGKSQASHHQGVSGETAKLIDQEVRDIIDYCYKTAENYSDG